ncbi:MAG: hypothetical protein DCC49_06100, partial [Acidobacteria bacterium]
MAFRPVGAAPSAPMLSGRFEARYDDIYPGTDFEVFSGPFSLKSEFIVTDSASMRPAYVYEIQSDLSPVAMPDGGLEWRDSTGNPVYVTPAGIAYDASYSPECIPASEEHRASPGGSQSGEHPSQDCIGRARGADGTGGGRGHGRDNDSSEVDLGVARAGDYWLLTATIDPAWAADTRREFPVRVDPGANWFVGADTFVTSEYPDLNRWDYESNGVPGHMGTYLPVRRVGQSASYGHNRTLFHLTPDDANAAAMSEIVDAKFNVFAYSEANKSANSWWILPTTDWSPYSVTWNTQPSYSTTHSGYMNIRNGSWMSSQDPKLTDAV